MNAPEGFIPYEMETEFGTVTLPDKGCAMCIAGWSFFRCNMCCFTQTLMQDARLIVDKINEDLNKYIKEHPEAIE